MNIAQTQSRLKRGEKGTFRMLKPNEPVAANDVVVEKWFYDTIAPGQVGQPVKPGEVILRLEFPATDGQK